MHVVHSVGFRAAYLKLLREDVLVAPNRFVFVEVEYSKDVVVPKVSRHSLN